MYEIIALIVGDLKESDIAFLIQLEQVFEQYGYEEHHSVITNAIAAKDQDDDNKDFADFVFTTYFSSAINVLMSLGIQTETSGEYDTLFLSRIFSALPKLESDGIQDVILKHLETDEEDFVVILCHILSDLTEDDVPYTYYLSRIVGVEPYMMQVLREAANEVIYTEELEEVDTEVLKRVKAYLESNKVVKSKTFIESLDLLPISIHSALTPNVDTILELGSPKAMGKELTALMLTTGLEKEDILERLEDTVMTIFIDSKPTDILTTIEQELNGVDFNGNN